MPVLPPVPEVDKNLGDLFHILARVVREVFEKSSLEDTFTHKITPAQLNMLALLEAAGTRKISELCRLHNITPPAATKNIDRLESLGLVDRTTSPDDRRLVQVEITADGRRRVRRYRQTYLRRIQQAMAGFAEEEKTDLARSLEDFIRNGIATNPDAAVICLQCQGRFSDSCVVQEHFDRCLYLDVGSPGNPSLSLEPGGNGHEHP